jgi:glucose-6-phosphate 1-dehydrogenase
MSTPTTQAVDALVIFGITGDLARKMTFRALYRMETAGRLDCRLIGVAKDQLTEDHLVTLEREALRVAGETIYDRLRGRSGLLLIADWLLRS